MTVQYIMHESSMTCCNQFSILNVHAFTKIIILDPECQRMFISITDEESSPVSLKNDYVFRTNDLELLWLYEYHMNYKLVNVKFCPKNEKSKTIRKKNEHRRDDRFTLHSDHPFREKKNVCSRKWKVIPDLSGPVITDRNK